MPYSYIPVENIACIEEYNKFFYIYLRSPPNLRFRAKEDGSRSVVSYILTAFSAKYRARGHVVVDGIWEAYDLSKSNPPGAL